VRVYLGARRLHVARHRGRLVVSLPGGGGRSVGLRLRGVGRHGRTITLRRRYPVACG
jgi:hypothetical protein